MLVPGTEMHFVTFGFVCTELVIFFYLIIYRLARPDDKATYLNILLIALLIIYNVTSGLLPDPKLPGSYSLQLSIAYATGFMTPCYFPYYVYRAFDLKKMKFHAYRGVFFFLVVPYLLFVLVFHISNDLDLAKGILVLPVLYSLWVLHSLYKALQFKYQNDFSSRYAKEEIAILFLSITPWMGLPFIAYFDLNQTVEATTTNTGFLLLLALYLKKHIRQMKLEHENLVDSELRLLTYNERLQHEVSERTSELEKISEQKTNTLVNLAHETKTPLTLIVNYLDEYIERKGSSVELEVLKKSVDKLTSDIVNLFDLERFEKGFEVYNHQEVCNLSDVLNDNIVLFQKYAANKNIEIMVNVQPALFVKADPVSVNRILNNLLENAIKFSVANNKIEVKLNSDEESIFFSVQDYGVGIPANMQKKIFEPYFQIANRKMNSQGMGLGLPIVKKVIDSLNGDIKVESFQGKLPGTKMIVRLQRYHLNDGEKASAFIPSKKPVLEITEEEAIHEFEHDDSKATILLVEDNLSMLKYLRNKLAGDYNVYPSLNGSEALKKLKATSIMPDLIISDVMMDKLDGYAFAKIISADPQYHHIPFLFVSAKSSKEDKLTGLQLGAIDFIQKPFYFRELQQKIDSILRQAEKQKQALFDSALGLLSKSGAILPMDEKSIFEKNCEMLQFTQREKDIASLICQGDTYIQIAEASFISKRTVAKHAQNIFEKAEVGNRLELSKKLGK